MILKKEISAYAENLCNEYMEHMDFSLIPTMPEIAIHFGVSEQTIRRRMSEMEFKGHKGFIDYLRISLAHKMIDEGVGYGKRLNTIFGFDSYSSFHRYIKANFGKTPVQLFGKKRSQEDKPKIVYVFQYPNGVIKFGVSINPRVRLAQHRQNPLSGHSNPDRTYDTGPTLLYKEIESCLIDHFSFYRTCSSEWIEGVSFNDVVATIEAVMQGNELPALDSEDRCQEISRYYEYANKKCIDNGFCDLDDLSSVSRVSKQELIHWVMKDENKFKLAIDAALYRKGMR